MRLNDLIRFYRRRAGLTIKAASAEIGVTKDTVKNWEHGRSVPKDKYLPLISKVFALSMAERESLVNAVAEARLP